MFLRAAKFVVAMVWVLSSALGADEPNMRIRLKDGSFANGSIVANTNADQIAWLADGFVQPFEFDAGAIRTISRGTESKPAADGAIEKSQEQLIELAGGSVVVGKLAKFDDDWLTVQSQSLGTVQLDRRRVVAIVDAGYEGQIVYTGPVDDERWQRLSAAEDWEFEGGALVATKPGAAIVGNVELPNKSQINLVLSWRGVPDFVMSFGTLATNQVSKIEEVPSAARLEVWDKQLALVREVDGGADIAMLSVLSDSNPRVELSIYLDQDLGTVLVCDSHGRPLETLQVPANKPAARPSVHLASHGPTLTIERFEVRAWDGVASTILSSEDSFVLDDQGEAIEGAITGFDADSAELLILSNSGIASRLPISRLRRGDVQAVASATAPAAPNKDDLPPAVVQPPTLGVQAASPSELSTGSLAGQEATDSSQPRAGPVADRFATAQPGADANGLARPWIELVLMDRTRLFGNWSAANAKRLQFEAQGLSETIQFSAESIRGIIGSSDRTLFNAPTDQLSGTLKLDDSQLAGYLEDVADSEHGTGLNWHPLGSIKASLISETASGAIVYRKPLPKVNMQTTTVTANVLQNGLLRPLRLLGNAPPPGAEITFGGKAANPQSTASGAREVMFRTGDAVDAVVEKIDETGMSFRSTQTTTTFVTHDLIQHVWLNPVRGAGTTTPEKLKRLMTVPRSMKQDPPTHLFIAVTGDYLRGRLVRLDGEMLTVEIRLELTEIPTSHISQIVWLHDRDWSDERAEPDAADTAKPAAATQPFQVHAIAMNDRGLTFEPQRFNDGALHGVSQLLGECSVPVKQLSQLLFGKDIGDQIRMFREDPWTLSLAQYPRVYTDEGGAAGAASGVASPLVGKPAPDFLLKSLDGQSFRLSKQRDRVVVLDFWASWCGPCIQTMPLVEKVVEELGSDKFHLVAVNIQETPARAQSAVDRLNMAATVLLDSDGQTAAVYAANAIPQTVIIDRAGTVTHVFVGGGPKFVEQFRAALESLP